MHHPALWASILHVSSVKAFIIPCSVGGRKAGATQTPTQRPGGREELLGLTFHPGLLSICSWSRVLRSNGEQHGGGEEQSMVLPHSTVRMGAKPGLAEVPPGQLRRFKLRTQGRLPSLSALDFLSPFSSRLPLWLAISNSGISVTP